MKKTFAKIFSAVLTAIILLSILPITGSAAELNYEGLLYEVSDGGNITITGYESNSIYFISIPAEIDGQPVTKIASCAFNGCWGLTEVSIPASIVEIGEYGKANVFEDCFNLEKISVDKSNPVFCDIDGVLFNYAYEGCPVLAQYPLGKADKTYVFPDNAYGIYSYAFKEERHPSEYDRGRDYLESVVLPEGMSWVGYSAFEGCLSLKSITIPDSISYGLNQIAQFAFKDCNNLTDVYYNGNEEDWNGITIESGNDSVISATKHFLSTHVHTWEHIVNNPTCTQYGGEYDCCKECGKEKNYEYLKPTGHAFGEWKVVKEPTTSQNGQEQRVCSKCKYTEKRTTDKLSVAADKETGVEIVYNKEFDKDTTVKVSAQSDDSGAFKIISDSYGTVKTQIFDITPYKNNEKVQPNGKVTVRIPLPNGFNPEKVFVCFVDSENGTAENIDAKVSDGYVEFETDHFSTYAIIKKTPSVKEVKLENAELKYKSSSKLNVEILADEGAVYTVSYSSSKPQTISVDENGNISALARGSTEITCTVTESYGNSVSGTCTVKSNYSFGQWLIKILLFGWIWY